MATEKQSTDAVDAALTLKPWWRYGVPRFAAASTTASAPTA
jgi:hypothetical protein